MHHQNQMSLKYIVCNRTIKYDDYTMYRAVAYKITKTVGKEVLRIVIVHVALISISVNKVFFFKIPCAWCMKFDCSIRINFHNYSISSMTVH